MVDQAAVGLGYSFQNTSLLSEALTHASIAGDRLESNERMEFLGDAILGFVVCEYLYLTYPELLEGELTKIKSEAVSRRVCAKISHELNLAAMLNLGKGMAGLIDLIRKGHFKKGENVIFIHTGGAVALFAYQSVFTTA